MTTAITANAPWMGVREQVRGRHPEEAAGIVLDIFRVREPPTPLVEIVHGLGISLKSREGGDAVGYALSSEDGSAEIRFRREAWTGRNRFTVAHELGHILLHPLGKNYRDEHFSSIGMVPDEVEANAFAAGLLVPLPWLSKARHVDHSVSRLAKIFGVSRRAMEIRLEVLERRGLPRHAQ